MQEFFYRIGQSAVGHFPGHHRSRLGESGQEFRSHVALHDAPDVRRLDVHASLRDPMGQWLARVASERKSVPVYAVADLSASMGFVGERRKLDVLADFTESLAWSAWRTGDAFGFVGCDETVRGEWLLPLARTRGVGRALAQRLRGFEPSGREATGLQSAHRWLRGRRSLVFLLSDFHFPLAAIDALLGSLAQHELVPVLLWDRAEFEPPLRSGGRMALLADAESARRRVLWLRRSVRERWRNQLAQRRDALAEVFRRRRVRPLVMLDGFNADAVSAHFHG
ncbi:MAG: MxaS protein [Rhizobacter sp.]|nr:MxaS protein [Rhizobacter sp.]